MTIQQTDFEIGKDVGLLDRWFRLIVGVNSSALAIVLPLVQEPVCFAQALAFLRTLGLYLALILGVYLEAFYFLSERVLAKSNP